MTKRDKRIWAMVRKSGAHCTCYWDTGDHSDHCEMTAAWNDAASEVDQAIFDAEQDADN